MTTKDWIDGVTAIVNTALVISGFGLACWSVGAWRRQLRGTTEYQVFRKILERVLKLKYEIVLCRSRHRTITIEALRDKEKGWQEEREAYSKRIERLLSCEAEIDAAKIEAAALFGENVNEPLKSIRARVTSIWSAYQTYFDVSERPILKKGTHEFEMCQELYGSSDENDIFWGKVEAAVREAEEAYRPRLKKDG